MGIRIISPGFYTTVQDLGRTGYQQFGMPVAGAVDQRAFRLANLLCGNPETTAALECTWIAPEIEFTAQSVFAVTGAEQLLLNGRACAAYRALAAQPGDRLCVEALPGSRCYIAFCGGLDVPVVMGSRSTYAKALIGGLNGRALLAGDEISFCAAKLPDNLPARCMPAEHYPAQKLLRVIPGPQEEAFTDDGMRTFLSGEYRVGSDSDRMGCRLTGPQIAHRESANIISDGIAFGAIQVPGSGQPIIMLSDRQTTGGYTKIANVISCDLPLIAQARPGDMIRFAAVSVEEAQQLYLESIDELRRLRERFSTPVQEKHFAIRIDKKQYDVRIAEITQ